jgi:hypothetical protein
MSTELRMSPQMERIAKQLAARYEMDWTQSGAYLMLAMPERPERWLLINMDGERFSLTCCLVEPDETLVPEVDMVFILHPEGWEPIELLYSNEAFTSYVQNVKAAGLPVYDSEGNLRFDTFTEYWAEQLNIQGWAEYGQPLSEEESCRRMVGCESTNHPFCYGELWQCAACGKTVCCNEGSDDHPELCDDCWVQYQAEKDEWEAQVVTRRNHHTLQLVCDCPEQCDTVLKLAHDGFLIVEDKDGLLVSFLLPDWLDFAIRRALLAHLSSETESIDLGRLEDDVPF